MISWVDSMLVRWGIWSARSISNGLGYSKVSPMFRDMPTPKGFGGSYEPGYTPTDLMVLDKVVQGLQDTLKAVLVGHYQHGKNISELSRLTGWSRTKVKRHIDDAQAEIARQMTALGVDKR